jgi:hypothetical protein
VFQPFPTEPDAGDIRGYEHVNHAQKWMLDEYLESLGNLLFLGEVRDKNDSLVHHLIRLRRAIWVASSA